MANDSAKIHAQHSYNRKQVQYLCGISQEHYTNFQMEMAFAFLWKYYSHLLAEQMIECPLFRGWWIHQWDLIDEKAIVRYLYETEAARRYGWYRQQHHYIFDPSSGHYSHLVADFEDLLPEFERAINPNTVAA